MSKTITLTFRQITFFMVFALISMVAGGTVGFMQNDSDNYAIATSVASSKAATPNGQPKVMDGPTQANVENAKVEGPKVKAEYFKMKSANSMNDVITIFRGACYNYFTDKAYCNYLKFTPKIFDSNQVYAITTIYFYGDKVSSNSIEINPVIATLSVADIQWIAYHELSHVQTVIIAKTAKRFNEMNARANAAYPSKDKNKLIGGEVLADCMTMNMAGAYYTSVPGYIQNVKGYDPNNSYSALDVCMNWDKVLYGDDKIPQLVLPTMPNSDS